MHPLNYVKKLGLSSKTILVHDKGLFVHAAMKLAEDYKRVLYYSPCTDAFCVPMKRLIGEGMPGIERVNRFFEAKQEADVIAFFDDGQGDVQMDLRQQGLPVFGCGNADDLEQDRWTFKKTLRQRGLAVEPFVTITGIEALVKHLKTHDNLFIKLNNDSRGLCETFRHENYALSMTKIDEIAYLLGPLRETQRFMVCEPLPGLEPGSDHFFTAGDYCSPGIYGWENKDKAYLGKVLEISDFPKPVKAVLDAMRPVYAKMGVQGALSTEMRGEKTLHFIDACMRLGCPPSGVSVEGLKNFGEVVYQCAINEPVKPDFRSKYVAEVIVTSPTAECKPVPLDIKEKDLAALKVPYVCRVDGMFYRINIDNGGANVAEAVGFGNTAEEAQFEALAAAEKMKCEGATFDAQAFEALEEDMQKGENLGLGKF